MKGKIIISILLLLFVSCKKVEENKIVDIKSAEDTLVPKYGSIFFEYDKIDHYKLGSFAFLYFLILEIR